MDLPSATQIMDGLRQLQDDEIIVALVIGFFFEWRAGVVFALAVTYFSGRVQ